ncbi:MAG: hypothetical protein EAX86_04550 [Candidatus Heimdallarchaeota archaeon]|nr:hypothetical protein [Candidatus Heimdallarchaeota archaeon]
MRGEKEYNWIQSAVHPEQKKRIQGVSFHIFLEANNQNFQVNNKRVIQKKSILQKNHEKKVWDDI